MNIKKQKSGNRLTITINGRIDTVSAPEAESFINENLGETQELILDFKDVNYVSSAGLRVLLSLQKKMNARGEMKLINVSEAVSDVFEVTGFSEIIDYETGE
ncbi:MAG: STAS domain-containing protein [Ruminococcus sp.]|nr:STAS domain-containing protein [Ruminococcus sp.]